MHPLIPRLKAARIVPVVLTTKPELAERAVAWLRDAGITVFEITMTVPDAPGLIRRLAALGEEAQAARSHRGGDSFTPREAHAARDADAMMADATRLVRSAITAAVAQVEAAAKVEATAKEVPQEVPKEVPQEAPLPASPKAPLPTAHYDTIVADSLFNMVAAGSDTIPLAAMGDFLRGRGDVPTEVIEDMVTSLDTDGNGVIDLDEWRAGWLLLAPKLGN
jgi:hypothetical protein